MPKKLLQPIVVHGDKYMSYRECAVALNTDISTVMKYVKQGRADELPPVFKRGVSAYLDLEQDKLIVRLYCNLKRSRETNLMENSNGISK